MIELLAFLGGGTFRAFFTSIMDWFKARQDHAFEIERMRLSFDLDVQRAKIAAEAAAAAAKTELDRLAAEYAGKTTLADAALLQTAFEAASKPSGIWIVDLLNGLVRPLVTFGLIAFYTWAKAQATGGPTYGEEDRALLASVLGFFFADRTLRHRGGPST